MMATTEEEGLGIDFDEERLAELTAEREEALEDQHQDEARVRFMDLDGDYARPEVHFNWEEEDTLARQLAAVAEWPTEEVRKFREEAAGIEDDDRFKDEHKAELTSKLASEYLAADAGHAERGGTFVQTEHDLRRLEKKIDQKATEFTATEEPDPDRAAYSAQREKEIRQRLAEADDAAERMEMAERLVDSGDPEAVRAVLDPPPGTSPISEQFRQSLETRVLERKYGDQVEQVQALRGLVELARHNLNEAKREIASAGGLR